MRERELVSHPQVVFHARKSPLDVVAGWTIETAGARLETSIGTFGDGDCELDIYLFNGKKVHIDFYAKDFSSDPGFR